MASTHEYTDAADIKRLIPDIEQSSNFDSDSEIDAYISEAEALVNSKLSARYSVPFSETIPPIIKYITGRVTVYNILLTEYTQDAINDSAWVEQYKDALDMLTRIADGESNLVDSEGNDLISGSTIETYHGDYTPIFGLDDYLEQSVDSDLLDDLENDRD